MVQNKKQLPAGSMILLITVLFNAIILETAYIGNSDWYWALFVSLPFLLIALRGSRQKKRTPDLNYPLTRHLRYYSKSTQPESKLYFFKSYLNGKPFNRQQRSVVYQRATKKSGTSDKHLRF